MLGTNLAGRILNSQNIRSKILWGYRMKVYVFGYDVQWYMFRKLGIADRSGSIVLFQATDDGRCEYRLCTEAIFSF